MADDAEGVTKTECSLYGADPYWGRILSELGASGALIDPERTSIAYNGHVVCRNGIAAAHDAAAVATAMQERRITIDCELGLGTSESTILTTDLGHGYIDENMGTS
jgi:glutamate N-acetyltransferase/amino-acid N-acetyltransferase